MGVFSTFQATAGALKKPLLSAFIASKRRRRLRNVAPSNMEGQKFSEMFDGIAMDKTACRLGTFYNANWPNDCPISMCDLATAGFCYTGTEDEVVCFSCRGTISKWEQFEVPLMMHYKTYPTCKFAKVLAEEIPEHAVTHFDSRQAGPAEAQVPFDDEEDASSDTYLTSELIFFGSEFNRLMTFSNWPLLNPADQYDLAASGFICPDEKEEYTVCVACGLEVREWKLGELPQRKHAELSPECSFVRKKDGNNREMDSSEKHQYVTRRITSGK